MGDEEEVADRHEDRQEVDDQRRIERRNPEQAKVDHRVRGGQLPTGPQDADDDPDSDRRNRDRTDAVLRDLLEAEDDGEDGDEGHERARHVEAASVGSTVLGQNERSEDEQQSHDRQGNQEDRSPPEVLEEHAADQRPHSASGGERRDPERNRPRSFTGVLEHVEDERQRRRGDRRAGDAKQRPAGDEHFRAHGYRRQDRGQPERPSPDEQKLAPADPIAHRAHRHQEASHHEPVYVDDPQELGTARMQVPADRRHRQIQDREVHDVDERRQGKDPESHPLPRRCLRSVGYWHDGLVTPWISSIADLERVVGFQLLDPKTGKASSIPEPGAEPGAHRRHGQAWPQPTPSAFFWLGPGEQSSNGKTTRNSLPSGFRTANPPNWSLGFHFTRIYRPSPDQP